MRKSLFASGYAFPIDREAERDAMGLSFGIAGASFAVLVAFACIDSLSDFLIYSAYCFSVALPLAIFHAMVSLFIFKGGWSIPVSRWVSVLAGHTSHLAGWAGVTLMLYHVSHVAAVLFLLVSGPGALALVVFARKYGDIAARLEAYEREQRRLNGEDEQK